MLMLSPRLQHGLMPKPRLRLRPRPRLRPKFRLRPKLRLVS